MSEYWDSELKLDYNSFIEELETHRLGHYSRKIKESGCKIMIAFPIELVEAGKDTEYSKWCKANCNEKYFVYNEHYVFFKTEEDAIAFKLRWS